MSSYAKKQPSLALLVEQDINIFGAVVHETNSNSNKNLPQYLALLDKLCPKYTFITAF